MEISALKELIEKIKKEPLFEKDFYPQDAPSYKVFIHSEKIEPYLKERYSLKEIEFLSGLTLPAREIKIVSRPWGSFISAASFDDSNKARFTNYDAVWIRDSLWGYLALKSNKETKQEAKEILLTLFDYIVKQRGRILAAIENPSRLDEADGKMKAIHIRFDSNSASFDDVSENGKAQEWNHKQNDALGLLLDCGINALRDGVIDFEDLEKKDRFEMFIYLAAYLSAVKFYGMKDSGAWEEEEKLNSSSIALVCSAFENLLNFLKENSLFCAKFTEFASKLNLEKCCAAEVLEKSLSEGYKILKRQIELGGESVLCGKKDPHYREADAALLNIIYPSKLSRLSFREREKVLNTVESLSGIFGIKRYEGDNYQAANFWFHNIKTDTDAKSIEERKKHFICGSEAEWFFDSWFSLCCLKLYQESKEKRFLERAFRYLNRALGQITGADAIGADGKKVPSFCLPESYNFLICARQKYAAASPIIPLNWAKASLSLMFKEFKNQGKTDE
ncbi:MAG: hypothetical protein LBH29_06190 [Elusimicrobiota bacterium]|jgi:hypothetical protein|nr:hypothetical protein [Elusimicrobiota bacterium]